MSLTEKYDRSVLSLEEVAAELGGSTSEVESLIESGELAAKKIGERVIVPVISLERYLKNDSLEESFDQRYTTERNDEEEVFHLNQITGGSILYVKARDVYRYAISNGKDPVTGKRNRIVKGDFHSREEAQAALQKALNTMSVVHSPAAATGVMPEAPTFPVSADRPRITVRNFLNENLLIMFSAPTPRTADCYANAAKLLVKYIGDMYLDELTRTNLQETLNGLVAVGLSQSSIDKARLVIKKFTEFAAEERLIPVDVGRKVKKVKSTQIDLRSDDERIYSKEQINTILSCAQEESDPMLLAVLNTLALTGMRPEELRGLEKKDVHFDTKEISIRQAATMKPKITPNNALAKYSGSREPVIGPTKTPAGVRSLYVGEQGIAALQEWLDYLKANDPVKYQSRFLFPSTSDAPLRDDVLNTKFSRFKQRHGLDKEYSLYRFRHTFCTNLAEANVSIKTAMRLMGDSTTNVVLGVYTHVRTDEARRAGEKINQVYTDMLAKTGKPDDEK